MSNWQNMDYKFHVPNVQYWCPTLSPVVQLFLLALLVAMSPTASTTGSACIFSWEQQIGYITGPTTLIWELWLQQDTIHLILETKSTWSHCSCRWIYSRLRTDGGEGIKYVFKKKRQERDLKEIKERTYRAICAHAWTTPDISLSALLLYPWQHCLLGSWHDNNGKWEAARWWGGGVYCWKRRQEKDGKKRRTEKMVKNWDESLMQKGRVTGTIMISLLLHRH